MNHHPSEQVHEAGQTARAVIVDIDGTLALREGRRAPYEYDKVYGDTPNVAIVELVRILDEHYALVFVSGREDSSRDDTVRWLAAVVGITIGERHRLHMRRTGDYRRDDLIKREIFEQEISGFFDVAFVLDDRDQVVTMWRNLGLTCLQVAEGAF